MIPNLKENNVSYSKDGKMVFKPIGEKIGKKGTHCRKRKCYPRINLSAIKIDGDMALDFDLLAAISDQYAITKKLPPVWLTFDKHLIGGYEIYYFAKNKHLKDVPYLSKKPNKYVSGHQWSDRPFKFIADNGSSVYISKKRGKHIRVMQLICTEINFTLKISTDLEYTLIDDAGNVLFDHEKQRGKVMHFLKERHSEKNKIEVL